MIILLNGFYDEDGFGSATIDTSKALNPQDTLVAQHLENWDINKGGDFKDGMLGVPSDFLYGELLLNMRDDSIKYKKITKEIEIYSDRSTSAQWLKEVTEITQNKAEKKQKSKKSLK